MLVRATLLTGLLFLSQVRCFCDDGKDYSAKDADVLQNRFKHSKTLIIERLNKLLTDKIKSKMILGIRYDAQSFSAKLANNIQEKNACIFQSPSVLVNDGHVSYKIPCFDFDPIKCPLVNRTTPAVIGFGFVNLGSEFYGCKSVSYWTIPGFKVSSHNVLFHSQLRYSGKPKYSFDRLKVTNQRVDCPLAVGMFSSLHLMQDPEISQLEGVSVHSSERTEKASSLVRGFGLNSNDRNGFKVHYDQDYVDVGIKLPSRSKRSLLEYEYDADTNGSDAESTTMISYNHDMTTGMELIVDSTTDNPVVRTYDLSSPKFRVVPEVEPVDYEFMLPMNIEHTTTVSGDSTTHPFVGLDDENATVTSYNYITTEDTNSTATITTDSPVVSVDQVTPKSDIETTTIVSDETFSSHLHPRLRRDVENFDIEENKDSPVLSTLRSAKYETSTIIDTMPNRIGLTGVFVDQSGKAFMGTITHETYRYGLKFYFIADHAKCVKYEYVGGFGYSAFPFNGKKMCYVKMYTKAPEGKKLSEYAVPGSFYDIDGVGYYKSIIDHTMYPSDPTVVKVGEYSKTRRHFSRRAIESSSKSEFTKYLDKIKGVECLDKKCHHLTSSHIARLTQPQTNFGFVLLGVFLSVIVVGLFTYRVIIKSRIKRLVAPKTAAGLTAASLVHPSYAMNTTYAYGDDFRRWWQSYLFENEQYNFHFLCFAIAIIASVFASRPNGSYMVGYCILTILIILTKNPVTAEMGCNKIDDVNWTEFAYPYTSFINTNVTYKSDDTSYSSSFDTRIETAIGRDTAMELDIDVFTKLRIHAYVKNVAQCTFGTFCNDGTHAKVDVTGCDFWCPGEASVGCLSFVDVDDTTGISWNGDTKGKVFFGTHGGCSVAYRCSYSDLSSTGSCFLCCSSAKKHSVVSMTRLKSPTALEHCHIDQFYPHLMLTYSYTTLEKTETYECEFVADSRSTIKIKDLVLYFDSITTNEPSKHVMLHVSENNTEPLAGWVLADHPRELGLCDMRMSDLDCNSLWTSDTFGTYEMHQASTSGTGCNVKMRDPDLSSLDTYPSFADVEMKIFGGMKSRIVEKDMVGLPSLGLTMRGTHVTAIKLSSACIDTLEFVSFSEVASSSYFPMKVILSYHNTENYEKCGVTSSNINFGLSESTTFVKPGNQELSLTAYPVTSKILSTITIDCACGPIDVDIEVTATNPAGNIGHIVDSVHVQDFLGGLGISFPAFDFALGFGVSTAIMIVVIIVVLIILVLIYSYLLKPRMKKTM